VAFIEGTIHLIVGLFLMATLSERNPDEKETNSQWHKETQIMEDVSEKHGNNTLCTSKWTDRM
jgi:hypothetical protein